MKISVITPSIRPKGLAPVQRSLEHQTLTDFEWLVEIGLPKFGCDLARAHNRMLRRAQGELIVIVQDYIKVPPDGLQKFWDFYTMNPRAFITAPCGKTLDWRDVKYDWRKSGEIRKVPFDCWEEDYGAAPRKAFFDVGGYDEDFDNGWSWENVNLAERADKAGYEFWVTPDNRAVVFDHDAVMAHPFRGVLKNNDVRAREKRDDMGADNWVLDYLK